MSVRDKQDTESGQLLDVAYLQRWETQHAGPLAQALEKRQRVIQEAETERFAKARSAIISGIMRWRREGYTAAEAARRLSFDDHSAGYWGYTYTDLLNVLAELGVSRREYFNRSKGGDA